MDIFMFGSGKGSFPSLEAAIFAGVIFVFLFFWASRELIGMFNKQITKFRRSVYRNLVPILASGVIVVGIICGFTLRRAESAAARRVTGEAALSYTNEIKLSPCRKLQEKLAAQHKANSNMEKTTQPVE